MQWKGIQDDEHDVAYLEGFVENISYGDVFGTRAERSQRNKSSRALSSNTKYSEWDDDDVWAILVTPKPLTVKVTDSVTKYKNKKKKAKAKTIHDYDRNVRKQKRKISDLARKGSSPTINKKKPINPITINQTEFGETINLINFFSSMAFFCRHDYLRINAHVY